jgi:hypothetical protein
MTRVTLNLHAWHFARAALHRCPGDDWLRPIVLACALIGGCQSSADGRDDTDAGFESLGISRAASSDDAGLEPGPDTAEVGPAQIETVFLIVMENKTWAEIVGSSSAPYLNRTLIPMASVALDYKGPNDGTLHPSEPNYLWLEAGDGFGVETDAEPSRNHQSTDQHLVNQLEAAGVTWTAYQEDIAGDVCPLVAVADYHPKHNPMVFFDDVTGANDPHSSRCIEHMRPLSELTSDLAAAPGELARYNFITPNQCNDMHSPCGDLQDPIRQGDAWLKTWIPRIQASAAYQQGGVLLITWDEAEKTPACPGSDCPIGMLLLSPLAKGGGFTSSVAYDHSSTLKSLQRIFGVSPLLRAAAGRDVNDLADLFTTFP